MVKVLISAIGVLIVCAEVYALKCFICDSEIHGNACYDPLGTGDIQAMECQSAYRLQTGPDVSVTETEMFEYKPPEKQRWDPNWSGYPTDFECVQYEKSFDRFSKRQFIRRCIPRNSSPNFCSELQQLSRYQAYSLTKCTVCYSDSCNSSGNIKLSLFLNLIFFGIFYQCTSF